MATADLVGSKIVLHVEYREREQIKLVPGVRYAHKTQDWSVPLAWSSLAALRGIFGDALTLSPSLIEWAWNERQTRIDVCLAIKRDGLSAAPTPIRDKIEAWRK